MPGLLDFLGLDQQPQQGGLLNQEQQGPDWRAILQRAGDFGQGLLQASGPSMSPVAPSLGQMLGAGAQAMQQGDQNRQVGAMRDMQAKAMGQQFQQNQMAMQQTKDKQAAIAELASFTSASPQRNGEMVQPAGMNVSGGQLDVAALRKNPGFMNAYARAYGAPAAIEFATKKPEYTKVGAGETVLGPDMKPLYTAPEKQEPTELEKTLIAAGVQKGSPVWNQALMNYAQRKGDVAKTTINMPQDDGLSEYWKQLGKKLPDLESQARSAARTNTSLADMVKIGDSKTYSGRLAPGAIGASQFLESLGVKYQPEVLSNTREFEAQKNILVLDVMASMGGARGFSKEESAVLYDAFPKIIDSPEARSRIAKMLMNRNNLVIEDYNSTRDLFESAIGKKLPSPRFAPGTAPSPGGNSGPTPEDARAELERRRKALGNE